MRTYIPVINESYVSQYCNSIYSLQSKIKAIKPDGFWLKIRILKCTFVVCFIMRK